MNVLSLCDGMSCGQTAFEKVGIKVDNYYASEIKEIAIKATQHIYDKYGQEVESDYCPRCGAKMGGEGE